MHKNKREGSCIKTYSYWTPYPKINKLPFKEKQFYQKLRPILDNEEGITYEINDDFEDFENHFVLTHVLLKGLDLSIDNQIDKSRFILNNLLTKAINNVLSFNWKPKYDVNEKSFTQEVVIPLLNKLGFEGVHYNHGANEFGRDIIFSRINEFNEKKYCAVQVKVGNLSGKVRGEIDEIIQQLDDAFSMPVHLLNEPNDVYISEMIVVTSGKLTENAKQKIKHKINKTIAGSLTFLDKESIMNHFLRIKKADNIL